MKVKTNFAPDNSRTAGITATKLSKIKKKTNIPVLKNLYYIT